jgi:2-polyprenyl-3-methyl-5-hydroxy-6-metoxy-1,4-benzoquinol methylase
MTLSNLAVLSPLETDQDSGTASCVLCGGELRPAIRGLFDTRFGIEDTYDVGLCASCGLEQLQSRPTPNELKALYEEHYNFGGDSETRYARLREIFLSSIVYRVWTRLDGDIAFHAMRGRGRLLDIGCNEGRGLEIYRRNGFTPEGLELNEHAAAIARERGFRVYTELLEDFYPDQLYDVVVLSNVLEHSLNPKAMLLDAARLLKPGGQIRISCPNATSWLRRLFGRSWINWHVPFHIVFFSSDSLRSLLKATGFDQVEVRHVTPALWVSSSVITRTFSRRGKITTALRSPWLIPGLMFVTRTLFLPLLVFGNWFGHGDCLVANAIRSGH